MYLCSSFVRFDVIRRILMNVFDINVVFMMNFTNVDDKIIDKAKKVCPGKKLNSITSCPYGILK